jgi:Ni/Co efflux regulator RcnB
MKRHLFLSTVATACLLLPAAALADPPSDRGQPDKKDQPHQQGPEAGKGKPAAAAQQGPGGAGRAQSERGSASKAGAVQQGRQPQRQAAQHTQQTPAARTEQPTRQRVERAPEAQSIPPAAPTAPSPQREPGVRAGEQQTSPGVRAGQQPYQSPGMARQPQSQNPPIARQAPPPSLGQWHAPAGRPERNQAGQQWRQQHQNWDQGAAWRRSPDWWRGESSFRLFSGLRMSFFFVPDRGYIPLPSQYRNRHWQAGDYLPAWFRTYTVKEYARYGLPPPPYGCVWVWLNGDVALIDPSDGYILDIARNVW